MVAVVQSKYVDNGSGSLDLDTAPTNGNLIVAQLASFSPGTLNSTDWTLLDTVDPASSVRSYLLYRYVGPGESRFLPVLVTSGGLIHSAVGIELSGVSGVIANDIVDMASLDASAAGGAHSQAIAAGVTATADGQLALTFFMALNATDAPTMDGTWTEQVSADATWFNGMIASNPYDSGETATGNVAYTQGGGTNGAALFVAMIGPGTPAEDSNSEDSNSNSNDTPPSGGRRGIIVVT